MVVISDDPPVACAQGGDAPPEERPGKRRSYRQNRRDRGVQQS